ncbi:lipase maturation factor 2-like [Pollicipes pollicipes]|uniref:lipase maturation factor 2-like n=1 Tax=Pollicipes pollicipes TaxID=41117 RepID=UPI0018850ABA|nr:lipase maturation factor 2-like [Pollicipes pollicipes]
MGSTYLTRNAFLKAISAIYLIAFMSLYMQIPGLYGASGVLPAHSQLSPGGGAGPTLLRWRAALGLHTGHAMELAALTGALLALLALLFEMCRVSVTYAGLLVLYFSLVQVGQVFLFFQWDTLLMEAGLLAALLAPLLPGCAGRPADAVGLWLVRWLLFRLVFSTGAVKLLSHCPAWWGLTALEVHFESQCMPTPLAWLAHHLPPAVLRLSVVFSLVAELAVPFLFFAPVRRLRLAACYVQIFLQLMMMATGSFGFYSLLVLTLCLSLLDDGWLGGGRRGEPADRRWRASDIGDGSSVTSVMGLRLLDGALTADIAFTKEEFAQFVHAAVPAGALLGAASYLLTAAEALTSAALDSGGCCRTLHTVLRTLTTVVVGAAIFCCTLVPFTMLDTASHRSLPAPLRQGFADHVQPFHVFGSYGLFKQMTGVGGRPEIVMEGAHALEGPWQEIEFRYKPGDVATQPSLVLPHQPRLDWQMWIAALGDYHANPWITSLAYRLLTGAPEVGPSPGHQPLPVRREAAEVHPRPALQVPLHSRHRQRQCGRLVDTGRQERGVPAHLLCRT